MTAWAQNSQRSPLVAERRLDVVERYNTTFDTLESFRGSSFAGKKCVIERAVINGPVINMTLHETGTTGGAQTTTGDRFTALAAGEIINAGGVGFALPSKHKPSLEDFGAVGDGVADDTMAIVHLSEYIEAKGSYVTAKLKSARYKFKPADHYSTANAWRFAVEMVDVHHIEIIGNGAVFMQDIPGGWTVADPANNGNEEGPIQFRSTGDGTCYKIKLCDFDVEMVKLAYSGGVGDGSAHGVTLRGVKKYKLKNVNVTGAPTDGIYCGATYSDTYGGDEGRIIDCSSDGANRNGLSIVKNNNVKILRGAYVNSSGGSFRCGIDLEPNGVEIQNNILVSGVTMSGNAGRGITAIRSTNVKITGCDIFNNGREIAVDGACARVIVAHNNISPNETAGLGIDVGTTNSDVDICGNTIYMGGVPNYHIRVGFAGAANNIRVRGNTLTGEGGVFVASGGICDVRDNTHDVKIINGSTLDTNVFAWQIDGANARVDNNTINIDPSVTWAGVQNKFKVSLGTANNNRFRSHSDAVCNMLSRTSAWLCEYGYNDWSEYFFYDEGLSSDAFRIKRKGWGIRYDGDVTYNGRIVIGGFLRTTNINAHDNQVGDIVFNYATTSGNPIAYRCTVAGTVGVSAGTWVGMWNKS